MSGYRSALTYFWPQLVAMAALNLASKIQEIPLKLSDVVNTCYRQGTLFLLILLVTLSLSLSLSLSVQVPSSRQASTRRGGPLLEAQGQCGKI